MEVIVCEFESLLHYAIQFISLSTLNYRAVWWRIFHSPSASDWCNVLMLAKLLFSLPSSNGKLERVFSQVNVIKSEKRTTLSNEALNDLLMLTSNPTPLNNFSPDKAIGLWWGAKARRPNQRKRKVYKKRSQLSSSTSSSTEPIDSTSENHSSDSDTCILDDWDNYMCSDVENDSD